MPSSDGLRHFMYLDTERLRSFSAQLLGGVPESGTAERGHEVGGDVRGEAGLFKLVRAEGGADYRYHRTSTETKSLHHQVYTRFEEALVDEGLLEIVDASFNFGNSWTPEHFSDGSFVQVRGTVRLIDYSRNIASMGAFPKLLKAFKSIQMINIKNSADSGEITPDEATAQRRELNALETSVKNAPVSDLVLLGETLYEQGVVRVKVRPSGAPDECVFAGNGDSEWLTEGLAVGGITQSPPAAEWVAVGQVSAANPDSTLTPLPTGNGMEDTIEAIGFHFRDIIRIGSGAVFPAIEFSPLAVYRQVQSSTAT